MTIKISADFAHSFSRTIIAWQHQSGRRSLPWQVDPNPYRVLVSELMLQQTQVATVIPYFNRWMTRFPDANALAQASDDEVMALWQGLGYYARARNLKKAAIYITEDLQGKFPDTPAELREVPGVGPYTAGAISAFAFNRSAALVDGNVKRVFCRYFAIAGLPSSSAVNRRIWELAEALTPAENNRDYSQGLLDLGATVCTPRQPDCPSCPLQHSCQAYALGLTDELPTPKPKKKTPTREGHFSWHTNNAGQLFLTRRPATGIWSQLWCLPELSAAPEPQTKERSATLHGDFQHVFSHYKLSAKVWQVTPKKSVDGQFFSYAELDEIGLPTPIRKYLEVHFRQRSTEI